MGAKVELCGTFVHGVKCHLRRGEWPLVKWKTTLPSRIRVKLPSNIAEQIERARKSYYRFGEFSDALGQICARTEREPIEREPLRSVCGNLRIPGDFGNPQITWKSNCASFSYQQVCRRPWRQYLHRDEYIFGPPGVIAIEPPRLGQATYLFSKPQSMEALLAPYTGTTKDPIRKNRASVAERLGFLGRVVQGSTPRMRKAASRSLMSSVKSPRRSRPSLLAPNTPSGRGAVVFEFGRMSWFTMLKAPENVRRRCGRIGEWRRTGPRWRVPRFRCGRSETRCWP